MSNEDTLWMGLFEVTLLSLQVTLTATVLASFVGMPFGAWLALSRFKARRWVIATLNALMGIPPVVVGPVSYTHLTLPTILLV